MVGEPFVGWHLSLSRGLNRSGVLLGLDRSSSLLVLVGSIVHVVLLSGAVNGDLDGDGATINFLAVHLADSLGLELLSSQADETEATGLAALVTGLELLDHETRDGAQSDLGRDGVVISKDLLQLWEKETLALVLLGRKSIKFGRKDVPCPR